MADDKTRVVTVVASAKTDTITLRPYEVNGAEFLFLREGICRAGRLMSRGNGVLVAEGLHVIPCPAAELATYMPSEPLRGLHTLTPAEQTRVLGDDEAQQREWDGRALMPWVLGACLLAAVINELMSRRKR